MTDKEVRERLMLMRELNIRNARKDLWAFSCIIDPEEYMPDRWHLWVLCETLTALYDRTLTKDRFHAIIHDQRCPEWFQRWFDKRIDWANVRNEPYTKLMINMPPRHGKSRTIVNFCDWALGKDNQNRIILASYNDDLAANMSRYVRDGILTESVNPMDICYPDIFPNTKVQKDNKSFKKWALEGSFFSYLGAGLKGSLTGMGGNILLIDDPVKNADESFNDARLDWIWSWYTGTFISRSEKDPIQIINHTRWNTHDLCGRILDSDTGGEWLSLKMPVECEGNLLCESILPRKVFEYQKIIIDPAIFRANYYQEPIDMKGRLFPSIRTYKDLPDKVDKIIAFCDTADEGSDYLACFIGVVSKLEGYITDVYYTKEPMEKTEPELAKKLLDNHVQMAKFESNGGGKEFARAVEKILFEDYHTRMIDIQWFPHETNKKSRIISGTPFVLNHILFPEDWQTRWREVYLAISGYQREGKNKHDDAAEALTEFGRIINNEGAMTGWVNFMRDYIDGEEEETNKKEPEKT